MKLKPVINSINDVKEEYRELYAERDGKWYLDVEGMVEKAKLDEFRNNNITLANELKQFKDLGLDFNELKEASETARKVREKELVDAGDIETLVKERLQSTNQQHEQALKAVTTQLEAANSQLSVLMIDNVVRTHSTKAGVLPTAVDDVLLRARSVFKVKDGNIIATGPDGKPLYNKAGADLTVEEYVTDLSKSAAHLFASSEGSGATRHQQGGGGAQDRNNLSARDKMKVGLQERQSA